MIDAMISMQPNFPPDDTEDLATVDPATTRLCLRGQPRNLDRLAGLSSLEALWLFDINEALFAKILPLIDPLYLNFSNLRVAGLGPVARLQRLEALELHWNTKMTDVSFLHDLPQLRLLTISNCPKVRDLSPLAELTALEILHLSGGIWNVFKPATLAPLANLTKLRGLSLINIQVGDKSVLPVSGLKQLQRLDISNQFPVEEYARLSIALPETECRSFAPYVDLPDWHSGPAVMITGKRTMILKVPQDQAKIDTYVARFRALQEDFRSGRR